jgi:hypothetical protein
LLYIVLGIAAIVCVRSRVTCTRGSVKGRSDCGTKKREASAPVRRTEYSLWIVMPSCWRKTDRPKQTRSLSSKPQRWRYSRKRLGLDSKTRPLQRRRRVHWSRRGRYRECKRCWKIQRPCDGGPRFEVDAQRHSGTETGSKSAD